MPDLEKKIILTRTSVGDDVGQGSDIVLMHWLVSSLHVSTVQLLPSSQSLLIVQKTSGTGSRGLLTQDPNSEM